MAWAPHHPHPQGPPAAPMPRAPRRPHAQGPLPLTLLFCMSLLAPFFRSTRAASTLFTAAAQCRADLPVRGGGGRGLAGAEQGRRPPPRPACGARLTQVIHGVDVGVRVDEVLQHALHRQARGQDQRRGAIVHAGVQVRGSVPDQDLGGREGLRPGEAELKALLGSEEPQQDRDVMV